MGVISNEDALEAYATARRVHLKEITESDGIKHLVAARRMNPASASDYIRNLRQMLWGKTYHRTLNRSSTELYLRKIRSDFGDGSARDALAAVRAHIVYYQGISGGRSPGLVALCDEFEGELGPATVEQEHHAFEAAVEASQQLSSKERQEALSKWPMKPKSRAVLTTVYDRNPHVVVTILARASGTCESCGAPAPFSRRADGSPYLEVHHKVQLAHGGDDTVENAIAVCPNCHRRAHYG